MRNYPESGKKEIYAVNTTLLNILRQIVLQYGVETLSDAQRVKALLSDLAVTEPNPRKNALVACLGQGSAAALQGVPANERAACKAKLAERLNREEGLDIALCADTLDLLEAALFGVPEQKITCRNCGKELQAEWKACPYCGAQAADVYTPLPASAPSSSSGAGYGIGLIEPKPATRRKKRTPAVHRDKIESPPPELPAATVNTPETSPVSESERKRNERISSWSGAIAVIILFALIPVGVQLPIFDNTIFLVLICVLGVFILWAIVEKIIKKIMGIK
jgi:hypothetical protein